MSRIDARPVGARRRLAGRSLAGRSLLGRPLLGLSLLGLSLVPLCAAMPAKAATTLATQLPPPVAARTAAYIGKPAADQTLHLDISLPLRNQTALHRFLDDISNPASPNFRHYLSVAQFTDRYAPTAADYQAAIAFFTAQGLTVTHRWAHRQMLSVDGKMADVERVFHVSMGMYQHPTENRQFYSADRAPTLDLPVAINQVIGLDNFALPYRKLVRGSPAKLSRNGSGPGGAFTGTDMRQAYYPSGTLTGAGQSVGLMELDGLNVADVNTFFANGYGPANSVPVVLVKAGDLPTGCDYAVCDDSEQALDVEYAISMAPGLSSVRVYVALSPEKVLAAMACDNISKVLSTSWGWAQNKATDEGYFLEFVAQGQTNLTASGDYSTLYASGPWPEEDVYITGVGGTDLKMTGSGAAWSSETGWADSAGGPSVNKTELIPAYQLPYINARNNGSKKLRNVPDIAASANFGMELCGDGSCTGAYGGTSFASPIWAGFFALVNQYAAQQGKAPVGFINPFLYQTLGHAKNYTSIFHDVVAGTSGRFSATSGYDLVTGFGSPVGMPTVKTFIP